MGILKPNQTNYVHSDESNLLELHRAMEYNANGEPAIRTIQPLQPSTTTSFGEYTAVPLEPVVQQDALYGIIPTEIESFTGGLGTAGETDRLFTVTSGTSTGGYGVLRTKRVVRYRPGQGSMCRFTAAFTQGVANTQQYAGFLNQENALQVGYDGEKFGILRRTDGRAEIRVLTIGTPASGSETATITLNGVAFTVNITSGPATQNATTIANATFTGYTVDQEDGKVYFASTTNAPQTGTFSFSSATAAGTFSQAQQGVVDNNIWTYQENFNVDALDGTGPSKITIDPTKLNVYQIQLRWLGAGEIRFAIENPDTGALIFFHRIHYVNRNTKSHIGNPSFKLGYVAYNTGSAQSVTVTGGSMAGFLEGTLRDTSLPGAVSSAVQTNLNTAGTWYHLVSLQNPLVFANNFNLRQMIIERVSLAFQGNDPLVLAIVVNGASVSTPLQWNKVDATGTLAAYYSTTAASFTNPILRFATTVNINGAVNINLVDLLVKIPPQSEIHVIAKSSSGISKIVACLVWNEI
jgi:hypothetical protein